jgi:hypothetical protein
MRNRYVSSKERGQIGRVGAGIEHAGWILVPACRPHEMAIYSHAAMGGAWILGRGHACLKSQYPCGLQGRRILCLRPRGGPGR